MQVTNPWDGAGENCNFSLCIAREDLIRSDDSDLDVTTRTASS